MTAAAASTADSAAPPPRPRGDRLNPPATSRTRIILLRLRDAVETVLRDQAFPAGSVLVDYGCGNMPYRPLFEARGIRYLGADLPGNELAEQTFDAVTGRVDLPDASCDIVLSTQVLEHVVSPDTYLRECHRLLRPGGTLILSTHGYWWYHPDPTDFWRWTGDGLRRLLTLHGFEVKRTIGMLGLAAAGLQLFQDAVYHRMKSRMLRKYFGFFMQKLIAFFDRRHTDEQREKDAACYMLVAIKPAAALQESPT